MYARSSAVRRRRAGPLLLIILSGGFALQTPGGVLDPQRGIRQFTVGTGGIGTSAITAVQANSEVRNPTVSGVLKLTLGATGYT